MRRVAGQHVGAQHEEADRAVAAGFRQCGAGGDDAAGRLWVIQPDFGIFGGLAGGERNGARAGRVFADQHAQHIGEVFLRSRQPVLQRQEIRTHVLRRARNEAQQLRHLPQHAHLAVAAAAAAFRVATQALQHADHALRFDRHVEAAEFRELHHLAGGKAAQHRIARVAARLQRGQHGADVVIQEQHRRHHDIGAGDRLVAGGESGCVAGPFVGRVHGKIEAGQFGAQAFPGAGERGGEVAVHGDEGHPDFRRLSSHSAPSRRRGFRR